jgi:GNAT superfamily N-acetyltransferase
VATGLAPTVDPSGPVLVGMFVAPEERGRGVGAALVEAIADWARAANAARLRLWVTSTNGAAISLYRRCGFEPTGERRPRRLTPSVAEIAMVRQLGRIMPS